MEKVVQSLENGKSHRPRRGTAGGGGLWSESVELSLGQSADRGETIFSASRMVASHAGPFRQEAQAPKDQRGFGGFQSCCSAVMSWISWVNARFPGAYRIPGNEPLLDECVQTIVPRSF